MQNVSNVEIAVLGLGLILIAVFVFLTLAGNTSNHEKVNEVFQNEGLALQYSYLLTSPLKFDCKDDMRRKMHKDSQIVFRYKTLLKLCSQ
jgi:hypothetical protein